MKIKIDEAFSPDGNNKKDTANVQVTAGGSWTVLVAGHGNIAQGTGSSTFSWDGKVNGVKLDDGKYITTVYNGSESDSAEVIIDTKAPKFTGDGFRVLEQNSGKYQITGAVEDVGPAGLEAGNPEVKITKGSIAGLITNNVSDANINYVASLIDACGPSSAYRLMETATEDCYPEATVFRRDNAGNELLVAMLPKSWRKRHWTLDPRLVSNPAAKLEIIPLYDNQYGYDRTPYAHQGDKPFKERAAIELEVKVFGIDESGVPGNIPNEVVQLSATRIEDPGSTVEKPGYSGGHLHTGGPAGQFKLPNSEWRFLPTEAALFTIPKGAGSLTLKTDSLGRAKAHYLPFGFSGAERILVEFPGSNVAIVKDILIKFPNFKHLDGAVYEAALEDAHKDALWGEAPLIDSLKAGLQRYFAKNTWPAVLSGISLQYGGPYDNLYRWNFTAYQERKPGISDRQHLSHRGGLQFDISVGGIFKRFPQLPMTPENVKRFYERTPRFTEPFLMDTNLELDGTSVDREMGNWCYRYRGSVPGRKSGGTPPTERQRPRK